MVCSVEGHIFVTKVKPFSVAGEDDKVEVGDVIISIDNIIVFDISPEFIAKMIKKLGGRVPISLAIAKARRRTKFAEVYPPFVPYLRYCGLEIDHLQKKWVQQDKWNRWRPGRYKYNFLYNCTCLMDRMDITLFACKLTKKWSKFKLQNVEQFTALSRNLSSVERKF